MSAPGEAMRAFFDGRVREWEADRYADETYVGRGRVALGWLRRMGRGKRVLDVGCGAGHQALAAAHAGDRVVAMDFSPAMAAAALARLRREAPGAPAAVVVADACHLPFRDGAFDAAVALGVLGFVPDRPAMLAEAARVLAPGGELVCDAGVPEERVLLTRAGRLLGRPFEIAAALLRRLSGRPTPVEGEVGWYRRNFTKHAPAELEALVRGAGFRPVARGGAGFGDLRAAGVPLLPWRLQNRLAAVLSRASVLPGGGPLARHALTYLVRAVRAAPEG